MLAATLLIPFQTLRINFLYRCRGSNTREGTYKPPIKKIADTPNLRLVDICNFHMQINGNNSMKKSDTRLKTPVARI